MLTIIQILIIFTKNFSRYQNRDVRLGGVNNKRQKSGCFSPTAQLELGQAWPFFGELAQ